MTSSTLISPPIEEYAPIKAEERSLESFLGKDAQPLQLELSFIKRRQHWSYQCQQWAKRAFDLLGATMGILLISPLLLTIAALIKLNSPGPVLYKSLRIGKNYKPFHMYKFRTMCNDADAQRQKLREETQQQNGLFKLANDPRVTPIGKILRAFSLDELPQLLNVIRGEMSLVGPRPLPPDESELFESPYTLRFQVTPGMTGAWQVSGRSNTTFTQLCALEINYVVRWQLWTDFKILLDTFPAVLASKGAY